MDEPREYIDFMARYRDWIAIKRLGVRESTKPEEVSMHLAAIKGVIEPKLYKYLDIDTAIIDGLAAELTKGMRKGYDSLLQVLPKLKERGTKDAVKKACKNADTSQIAESYLLGRVLSNLGDEPFATPGMLVKVFPDLKLPKQGMPKRLGKG